MQDGITTLKNSIICRLSDLYTPILVNGIECFETINGKVFSVEIFPGEDALVIGYADNIREAELYRFEDGDRFYAEEMDEDEIFRAMILEIEG